MAVRSTHLERLAAHRAVERLRPARRAVQRAGPGLAARLADGARVLAPEAAAGPGALDHAVAEVGTSGIADL